MCRHGISVHEAATKDGTLAVIHASVSTVTERYLRIADDAVPGRIEGLYLVGSVALGDYKFGQSDIDFVAVTGKPLALSELVRLKEVHRVLAAGKPRPWFDGIYVTWTDLEQDPEGIGKTPFTHEGRFAQSGGFEANPSTWLTLSKYSFMVPLCWPATGS